MAMLNNQMVYLQPIVELKFPYKRNHISIILSYILSIWLYWDDIILLYLDTGYYNNVVVEHHTLW